MSHNEKLILLIALMAFSRSSASTNSYVVSQIQALADDLRLEITDRTFTHALLDLVAAALRRA
jgi:hypothetical protein